MSKTPGDTVFRFQIDRKDVSYFDLSNPAGGFSEPRDESTQYLVDADGVVWATLLSRAGKPTRWRLTRYNRKGLDASAVAAYVFENYTKLEAPERVRVIEDNRMEQP